MNRKPHRINEQFTKLAREMYQLLPLLASDAKFDSNGALTATFPTSVKIYAVNQRRGRAWYEKRVVTVPVWAFTRPKGEGYALYYLAHELAHILNHDMGTYDTGKPHGPAFMTAFKRLCPVEYQHFEVGYKPRSAIAAGIKEKRRVIL